MRQIAFYGKGGIGKSTTTSNISAAMSKLNYRVMQIGCDPKADSTHNLTKGMRIPDILDIIREADEQDMNKKITLDDLIFSGFNDVKCCEAGGPEPGVGCAGRGIITAMELLQELKAFEVFNPDFVFYDVLGDVVCGGFAMPIRKGLANEVYVVTSGEKMALYACNNIFRGIEKYSKNGNTRMGGIIINCRGTHNELKIVEEFSHETNVPVIHVIPRDKIVQKSENMGMTTIEFDQNSDQAQAYIELAKKIVANEDRRIPNSMGSHAFNDWLKEHGEST